MVFVHRYLTDRGIKNLVVDSSSIEVNRRSRRAKTDRLDLRSLVRMLIRYCGGERGLWSVVREPSVEDEDARRLHRELERLKKGCPLDPGAFATSPGTSSFRNGIP
jgi:transposase